MDGLWIRDQRQPGWFFVDNEIVDQHGARLGAYGLAVYCVLSRYAKNGNQQVNLSARDIGSALGISQDRVRKSLADLATVGLVHLLIPERPAPGLISTITLLNVKRTERHTFSSSHERNATRARNKEVKTKTETETPPPLISTLFEESLTSKENARARETYRQEDFDERDLRKLGDAYKEINRRLEASVGSAENSPTGKQIFEWACEIAGISVKRGLELEKLRREWPAELEAFVGQPTAS
jgi:hypothetical protein